MDEMERQKQNRAFLEATDEQEKSRAYYRFFSSRDIKVMICNEERLRQRKITDATIFTKDAKQKQRLLQSAKECENYIRAGLDVLKERGDIDA